MLQLLLTLCNQIQIAGTKGPMAIQTNRGHRENAEPTGGPISLDARWRGESRQKMYTPEVEKSAKRKGVVG